MRTHTFLKYGRIVTILSFFLVPNLSSAIGTVGAPFKSYKDWMKKCVTKFGPHGTGTAKVFHLNEEKNILTSPTTTHPELQDYKTRKSQSVLAN